MTKCGFAVLSNVETGELEDRMESFVLSELLKVGDNSRFTNGADRASTSTSSSTPTLCPSPTLCSPPRLTLFPSQLIF